MLLMLDYGIYYEFIPVTNIHGDHPKAYSIEEVETGINYAVVISTNAGLWRYMIGDTVTFSNLRPYRIKVTGRTKSFINAFGEELIIDNFVNLYWQDLRQLHKMVETTGSYETGCQRYFQK